MFGAAGNHTALPDAERNRIFAKRDVERAAPDDYRLGSVVVLVPTARGGALNPDKPDVDPTDDSVILTFPIGRQALKYRAEVQHLVHNCSLLARHSGTWGPLGDDKSGRQPADCR